MEKGGETGTCSLAEIVSHMQLAAAKVPQDNTMLQSQIAATNRGDEKEATKRFQEPLIASAAMFSPRIGYSHVFLRP